jgi:phosphate-selective porin OprO and OprP
MYSGLQGLRCLAAVLGLLGGTAAAPAQFVLRVPPGESPPVAQTSPPAPVPLPDPSPYAIPTLPALSEPPAPFTSVQPQPSQVGVPNTNLEQRVRDLEATIRQLHGNGSPGKIAQAGFVQESPTAATQVPPSHPIPLETGSAPGMYPDTKSADRSASGWDNGFFLRSADGAYQLRITGQIQADLRDFLRHDDLTDITGFLVRRARLGIEATVFQYFEFRLLPDFGQGKTVIQDAYINIHYLDAIQLAAGKLKEPVSYEQLVQDRFVPTVERSIIDQLVPARDVGVLVHGQKLLGDKLDYAVGVFNGGINGDQDTNGHRDIAYRLAVRPLNFESLPESLHLVQIGISGSTGIENEPISPAVLRTPATVQYFQFNSTVQAAGLRNRWTPELSYFYGGLGFAAQYYREDQSMLPVFGAKSAVNVPFEGYYFMATGLLTGESRTTYSAPVVPLRPYEPLHPLSNPGAWELVARYSRLDVGSVVFAPGAARLADPTKYARDASELTLGFNWYLNAWVRMQFNYEHARFSTPVQLAPGSAGRLNGQDTILARMQVIF